MPHWNARTKPTGTPVDVPPIVGAGLVLAGLGLIGMTSGELPGIPHRFGIPPWFMGAVGGALIVSGLLPWLRASRADLGRTRGWQILAIGAAAGVLVVLAGHAIGFVGTPTSPYSWPSAINTGGRVLFGIGVGVLIGWAASTASRSGLP